MLISLKTAYCDTRAEDLAWALGREPIPALATLDLDLGGVSGRVQLRLLGASHQVILDDEHGGCSETVACLPGRSMPLPAGAAERVGDWDYEFAAHVDKLSRHAFTTRAQELLALVADHPNGLAGTFPGDDHAFTALLVRCLDDRIQWRTWHAYPQEGQVVMTRTRIVRHP
ncbi:DUF2617 family protein [Streptomyces sp. NPDC059506]|uniref:DUF2617 family protein n=1 Tax=unclassified Streptomyces TaxID=2593676 RepID=UPI000CC06C89|nr:MULTISPECIES: DUF2617 family protein [unclassified Streptomyces]MCZ2523771.1 DUF2617 family protein [Streptomyces sp. HB2AG]PLW71459.1 DUF2617 domain-containing protein [Streptomyces sp. DJ]QMV22363.1 DUF2617 family protein [Streptomyces sp. SCUT-3]